MKNPTTYLLQFFAFLMLVAVIVVTWAGVTYPDGRAKAYPPALSEIHPMCIHRVLTDERYENSINLSICHTEFQKHPITVETIESVRNGQELTRVASQTRDQDGDRWQIEYIRVAANTKQGPILIALTQKFPDGFRLTTLTKISLDSDSNILTAHSSPYMVYRYHELQSGGLNTARQTKIAVSQGDRLTHNKFIISSIDRYYGLLDQIRHVCGADQSVNHIQPAI